MENSPLVSIITVNYDQPEVTCEMLASLRALSYENIEILVVDNGSPKFDPQIIKDKYPEIRLIKSKKNLGFAGGNNLAIREASGKYLFFLNNDTEVTRDCIEPLVGLFENDKSAGVVSPKIIFYNSDDTIQYAGSTEINPWTGRNKGIGSMEKDRGQFDVTSKTDLAHGAAMMVPKAVIDDVGLMPEIYFLYYEELDWCEMIKRQGYSCHYVGESMIYHKESISVGKSSLLKTYYINRNRLLFIRRNFIGFQKWSSYFVFLALAIPKRSVTHALNGEWKHCSALWRGVFWNLKSPFKLPSP
ncbi:glycosyltransferase family 2 protein [Daejeonella sp.]|uniref:glycosyltransferase family 2 protein n=1 Tax=Daejeonella sp. TaxID=2805397 RepID=UPI003983C9C6